MNLQSLSLPPDLQAIALIGPMISTFPNERAIVQVAVDGGITAAKNPIAWVGDLDSSPLKKHEAHSQCPTILKASQDLSDLAFALGLLLDFPSLLHIELWGFWGGRFDHQWANFGEALTFLKRSSATSAKNISFYRNNGSLGAIALPQGQHSITINGSFSLLTVTNQRISITGDCKYHLHDEMIFPLSSSTISNTASGIVQFQFECPALLYFVNDRDSVP